MPRITQELLRKKAEHNEGLLSTLEEISLHQLDLEKIEGLDAYCRHLKILYLQSNLISKMEGLKKLKELEYINLAVNNVSKIEGIAFCESLAKLDLTLNFIDIEDFEESINNLAEVDSITELYLTGNPCTSWENYKEYIYAKVQQLRRLDGEDISKSQKIQAKQKLASLEEELRILAKENRIKKQKDKEEGKEDPDAYTQEYRVRMYEEMKQQKDENEKKSKENSMFKDFYEMEEQMKKKGSSEVYNANGEIRQCNEGKYEFKFTESEDKTCLILEIWIPKFMDTSLVNVDLNPKYARLEIKGKITQLKFDEEIIVEQSKLQRSQMTGVLKITCPKAGLTLLQSENLKNQMKKEEQKKQQKLKELEKQQNEAKENVKQLSKFYEDKSKEMLIQESKNQKKTKNSQEGEQAFKIDFDLSELPPLE